MEKPSDRELIGRAQRGDREAFEALARQHYSLVYRTAYKWCGTKETAEDVTQEVFIKVGRSIHSFKGGSAFTTWLYRITVNAAKDHFRSESTKRKRLADYADDRWHADQLEAAATSNPVSTGVVYAALDTLSTKLKEATVLVLAEGLTHREAARVLGCAEATVSWRLFEAKKKLKKLLQNEVA